MWTRVPSSSWNSIGSPASYRAHAAGSTCASISRIQSARCSSVIWFMGLSGREDSSQRGSPHGGNSQVLQVLVAFVPPALSVRPHRQGLPAVGVLGPGAFLRTTRLDHLLELNDIHGLRLVHKSFPTDGWSSASFRFFGLFTRSLAMAFITPMRTSGGTD